MEIENTDIVVDFGNFSKIECIKARTGEKTFLTISQNQTKLPLSLDTVYHIPISNKSLSYTDANCIKMDGLASRKIQIIDIEKGIAYIKPHVHNIYLSIGEVLGKLI